MEAITKDVSHLRKPILSFLPAAFLLGYISDLSYLYPGIHILKFVGFVIGMALLINVTIIETFVLDNDNYGFGTVLSFNFTVYVFGMITYYCTRNLYAGYFPNLYGLCYFALFLIVYHTSEFVFVCICHTQDLKWASFLINHSIEYVFAILACLIEYYLETNYKLFAKNTKNFRYAGIVTMVIGLAFRIGAFISAGRNFSHLIAEYRKPEHQLVTSGVYKISRHPSYLGWYLFTLGGQILLQNPVCLLAFAIVSWRFFYNRIKYEEYTLLSFFGQEYDRYRDKTPILIPFIDSLVRGRKQN